MIRFRLFGMPVEVRPSFLVIAALIGVSGGTERLSWTLAWIAVVFVSIVIHELGHAFAAKRYGADVAIEVNGLGGLTRWSVDAREISPGRRAFIAAAGSAVGVFVGGVVWAAQFPFGPFVGFGGFVWNSFVVVNVFWGLINWLPIRPLDGGHLLTSLLEKVAPARGEQIATAAFTITAAVALGVAWWRGFIFIAVLAAWMLFSELTSLGRGRTAPPVPGRIPQFGYDDPDETLGPSDDAGDLPAN